MTKKMRLWPYKKASRTVGSATTAAPATIFAAVPWPSSRMISASGAGLLAKTV